MGKKSDTAAPEVNQTSETQAEVTTESKKKERRLLIEATLPSLATTFLGSLTLTVVGLDKVFTYNYQTPELSEVQAKAMQTGFIARFSTVIGGLKTAEEIAVAVDKEIKNLDLGIFPIRSGGTGEAEFTDTIIALAMVSKTEDKRQFLDAYAEVAGDKELLTKVAADHDALTDDEKKAATSSELFKSAKRAVGYAKTL